jgi:hypothetical protein
VFDLSLYGLPLDIEIGVTQNGLRKLDQIY